MTSIFDEPAFVALMTTAEMQCAASFNAALSIPKIPVVRLTCKEAGFRNFATALEFKTDAIFRLFKKWLHFWLLQDKGPNYGCVIGDTWADFKRHYGRNVGHDIFFVVDATGCDEPVAGTVHLGGVRSEAFLSVDSIANLRKIALIQDNCMRVNMDILLFSLSFPQLDGVPVVSQVSAVIATSVNIEFDYWSKGKHESSCWPLLGSFPTYIDGKYNTKDLCVAQLIGLLQFSQVPRHPMKRGQMRPVKWGIRKGKWHTILVKRGIDKLRGKVTKAAIVNIL